MLEVKWIYTRLANLTEARGLSQVRMNGQTGMNKKTFKLKHASKPLLLKLRIVLLCRVKCT